MWFRFRRKQYLGVTLGLFALCFYYKGSSSSISHNEVPPESKQRRYNPRDIHVVIGYYQGNNLPWVASENLTDEILNTNMHSPDPSSGKDGDAVIIPSFEAPKMTKLYQINRFNLMASDRIPLNRSLPDVRRKDCQSKAYSSDLPTTSVIIVFHNEAWSTLMRTVHSVINRSPKELLADIILVDDASQRRFLGAELEKDVAKLPVRVKIVRSKERVGLIKARLKGAKEASGEVLTFLDAHCECTLGWLEPLLDRVRTDRKIIASPVIDIVNDDTFQYVRSFELHQGGFNWELHFRWFSLPSDVIEERRKEGDTTRPFRTPVMAGGLFSMDKKFFYELGSYDEKMEVWGGENLEISFRGWMCGATLEIVPCSHVGHLFRKSSPYNFPSGVGSTLNSNLARVALVWMDDWRHFYFKLHPEVAIHANNQSVSDRLQLRSTLQCKSFRWYLNNIWPHHFFPMEDRFFGKIRNKKASNKCLQSPRTKTFGQPYGPAVLSDCIVELYAPQLFVMTPEGFLRTDDNVCLDSIEYREEKGEVRIMACNTMERQKWVFEGGVLKHLVSGKCLDLAEKGEGVVARGCVEGSRSQQWGFEGVEWRG